MDMTQNLEEKEVFIDLELLAYLTLSVLLILLVIDENLGALIHQALF